MAETLQSIYKDLTQKEKAIICAAVRKYGDMPDAHLGMVPFFTIHRVSMALRIAWKIEHKRPYIQIMGRLVKHIQWDHAFSMFLSPVKVYRRFGSNPERGVHIPGLPKVKSTGGVEWNLGKKDCVPAKVEVSHTVSLKQIAGLQWVVCCSPLVRDKVIAYLSDHCGW